MTNSDLEIIAGLFKRSEKITVFTGAGISVNAGIPDFRSAAGLYSFVKKKYDLPYPEAIFDISYFKNNPSPFFDLSKDLIGNVIEPTLTHKFIAYLGESGKIGLVMTQNIDMLHQKAGSKNVVECHGTYETAHCLKCRRKYVLDEIKIFFAEGKTAYCRCGGIIKPDIVFFGEQLPQIFFKYLYCPPETDLLLVMGSSLTVMPAASFALNLARQTTSVIVNLSSTENDMYFTHVIHEDADLFSESVWDEMKR